MRGPAFPNDRGADQPGITGGRPTLRLPRMGLPSEHRSLAGGGADGRSYLGNIHRGWRVAVYALVGAFCIYRRHRFPAKGVSYSQGISAILPGFPGSYSGWALARDQSLL